jgi:hypothetical protein
MSDRAARRKSLTEADRLQFVREATDAHHRLAPYLIALSLSAMTTKPSSGFLRRYGRQSVR